MARGRSSRSPSPSGDPGLALSRRIDDAWNAATQEVRARCEAELARLSGGSIALDDADAIRTLPVPDPPRPGREWMVLATGLRWVPGAGDAMAACLERAVRLHSVWFMELTAFQDGLRADQDGVFAADLQRECAPGGKTLAWERVSEQLHREMDSWEAMLREPHLRRFSSTARIVRPWTRFRMADGDWPQAPLDDVVTETRGWMAEAAAAGEDITGALREWCVRTEHRNNEWRARDITPEMSRAMGRLYRMRSHAKDNKVHFQGSLADLDPLDPADYDIALLLARAYAAEHQPGWEAERDMAVAGVQMPWLTPKDGEEWGANVRYVCDYAGVFAISSHWSEPEMTHFSVDGGAATLRDLEARAAGHPAVRWEYIPGGDGRQTMVAMIAEGTVDGLPRQVSAVAYLEEAEATQWLTEHPQAEQVASINSAPRAPWRDAPPTQDLVEFPRRLVPDHAQCTHPHAEWVPTWDGGSVRLTCPACPRQAIAVIPRVHIAPGSAAEQEANVICAKAPPLALSAELMHLAGVTPAPAPKQAVHSLHADHHLPVPAQQIIGSRAGEFLFDDEG